MLADEYGTASNIKSRVNKLSVLSAITSTQQRLKLYTKVPTNGLVIYCGTIITDENKEKKVNFDFEPFKPINTSLYLCDNKFHTEPLSALLESNDKYGFIVMDGSGALFATLTGNTREILHSFRVELPNKHGRGGQSALRFSRLREEKRNNYVRKVAEMATRFFIINDKPTITGLILAGSADFKSQLSKSELFNPILYKKILQICDISYGGENGFNQAIEQSSEVLSSVKLVKEKILIQKFFEEIAQDTDKYVFGIEDTVKAMEMGALKTMIVWDKLDINRFESRNGEVKYGVESEEIADSVPFIEWIIDNYKNYGTELEIVTDQSQEGTQFCKGFSGVGGFLRYKVNFLILEED